MRGDPADFCTRLIKYSRGERRGFRYVIVAKNFFQRWRIGQGRIHDLNIDEILSPPNFGTILSFSPRNPYYSVFLLIERELFPI